jgi:hypothetical protein
MQGWGRNLKQSYERYVKGFLVSHSVRHIKAHHKLLVTNSGGGCMRTIAITGTSGYVGNHLPQRLHKQDIEC